MIGIFIAVAVLVTNAIVSYRATRRLVENDRRLVHSQQMLTELAVTVSTVAESEADQRKYLFTGDDKYLEPYTAAMDRLNDHLSGLRDLAADNPHQKAHLAVLMDQIAAKRQELREAINQRQSADSEATPPELLADAGKLTTDAIRSTTANMQSEENRLFGLRSEESKASRRDAVLTFLIATVIACGLLLLIFYLVTRDIAARKRSEELLSREHQWLKVTLASIGDAVIATDTNGCVTFMNPVAQTLTGWMQWEASGQPLDRVFNVVNEYSRQPVENPALRAIREGLVVGLANHTVLIAKDNTEIPIDDSGAPIKDTVAGILGSVLIFRDIRERRRQEKDLAQLAEIVDFSDDSILSKDLDGTIRTWNKAAERLLG
ncbi:MAG: CHASE3 domain-containing protein, partial [Blastocatellia bacterium]